MGPFMIKSIPSEKQLQGFAGKWATVSVEEYMANSRPIKGGFVCLVCSFQVNFDCQSIKKENYYHFGMVLHV